MESPSYWITRCLLQRSMGVIYLMAFLVAAYQFRPLCGEKGLLPVQEYLKHARAIDTPSIFWLNTSDAFIGIAAWIGVILAFLAVTGISDSYGILFSLCVWFLLWLLYLSFVNVGQTFYGFGWESLLLEAGFLTIFLGSKDVAPPLPVIWLYRWLLFRLMFGAGLIKIRGDECWRDFTCMRYHYETQPMPNPVSWYFHHLPLSIHKFEVLCNHIVELILPFFYFGPRLARYIAGTGTIIFQLMLVISGNFSWLNYLTICISIACFDDSYFSFLQLGTSEVLKTYTAHRIAVWTLFGVVAVLSLKPALNLVSSRQIMNTSFDPLHLVNTYGAFGSITKERMEIIIEGSNDPPDSANAQWLEYEFKGKPGDPKKRPPLVAPYHYRLDWQIWFAAMNPPCSYPRWLLYLAKKLLENSESTLGLLRTNPFPEKSPSQIRFSWYHYQYTSGEEREASGDWWKRKLVYTCPPLTLAQLSQLEHSSGM